MKKLDLHGNTHVNVRSEVIRFIEDNFKTPVQLEIITGKSTAMKALVIEVLDEYKLEYNIAGIFGLNHGIITVDMEGVPMND